jgi:hypothetical protein
MDKKKFKCEFCSLDGTEILQWANTLFTHLCTHII